VDNVSSTVVSEGPYLGPTGYALGVQEIVAGLASVDAAVAASAATIDASVGLGTGATTVAVGALNAVNTAGFISLNQN
jgi:hypothetical protein